MELSAPRNAEVSIPTTQNIIATMKVVFSAATKPAGFSAVNDMVLIPV